MPPSLPRRPTAARLSSLLNNASAMEVQEIEDNVGVDAILQVGLPGGYGFYGVADILSGAVSPSGHLTDTYAVKNANSPAAQNFGDLQWTNANPDISMNDAIVEAENIYIGSKYYETRYFDTVMGAGQCRLHRRFLHRQRLELRRRGCLPASVTVCPTPRLSRPITLNVDLKTKPSPRT